MDVLQKVDGSKRVYIGVMTSSGFNAEKQRARIAGVNDYGYQLPLDVDHLHFGLDLLIVISGSGRLLIGTDQIIDLCSDQIIIIPGGNRHRMSVADENRICLYGAEVSPSVFQSLALPVDLQAVAKRLTELTNPLPAYVCNNPSTFLTLKNLFEEMFMVHAEIDDPCHAAMMRNYKELLALHVVKLISVGAKQFCEHPTVQRVLKVQNWLDRHYAERITLLEMAQMANLSLSHFSMIFRRLTALSPKTYLSTRRLEAAASLLAHSNLPITIIAQNVGINDLTNFGHTFAKHTGCSPREYRKKFQQTPTDPSGAA